MKKESLQLNYSKDMARLKKGAVLLLAAVILWGVATAFHNSIIVYAGIRVYRIISVITAILLIAGAAGFIILAVIAAMAFMKLKKQEALDDEGKAKGPVLKVKGDLDPVQIRNNLTAESDKWTNSVSGMHPRAKDKMKAALGSVSDTMLHMDDYQARLKNLLDSNGAEALRDTEEVLDRVEQHICRNVRKLLNIMTVSSPDSANDIEVVELTARNCAEDNNKLLATTKEFIVAVTQFLNSQGDSGSGISEIEVYKKALTTQIEEGGIY